MPGEEGANHDPVALVRAGVHPLDPVEGTDTRVLDLGLGFEAELPTKSRAESPSVYGPYLEVGAYPLSVDLGAPLRLRGGSFVSFEALQRSNASETGLGGTLGLLLELTGGVSSPFSNQNDDSFVAGLATGRWGFGLYASGAIRNFSDGGYREASAGISIRIPFAVGVACCAWPKSSSKSESSHHDENSSSPAQETRPEQRPPRIPARPKSGL